MLLWIAPQIILPTKIYQKEHLYDIEKLSAMIEKTKVLCPTNRMQPDKSELKLQ